MIGFTTWRALADGVYRDHVTLEPHHSCVCTDPEWRESLLVVKDGHVKLSTAVGQVVLPPGAVFTVASLTAPVLHNPGPTRATVARARRVHHQEHHREDPSWT